MAKAGLGAAGVAYAWLTPAASPPAPVNLAVHLLHIAAFGAAAAALLSGGASDRRAGHLGMVLLLLATVFADRPLQALEVAPGTIVQATAGLLGALAPDAFEPAYLWLFLRDFPRGADPGPVRAIGRTGVALAFALGLVLFAANLLPLAVAAPPAALAPLVRDTRAGHFWTIVIALNLLALPFAAARARAARREERRRVSLLLWGIGLGLAPMSLEILLETLFPSFHAVMDQPAGRRAGALVVYPFLLSLPFSAAYAVLVQHALEVKVVARRALEYALARYSVLAAAAVPFCWLAYHVYSERNETVARLFSGTRPIALLAAATLGLLALVLRRSVLEAIDRRFFREHYDARRILTALVEKSRSAGSAEELTGLWLREIDRALHLDALGVLRLNPATARLEPAAGFGPSLPSDAPLAMLVAATSEPLAIDLEDPRSPLRRLPPRDLDFLADLGARLVAPLIASDGSLLGLITLGDKKSELPFSREDRQLLGAIATSGALALENRLLRSTSPASHPAEGVAEPAAVRAGPGGDEPARECSRCHRIEPAGSGACGRCGGELMTAAVPLILHGKFRLEKRIGAGGMGVVYRGVDLTLGRSVAIKTLPKIAPEHALRLRREARAMASVSHPNLALIHGAETWRGTPLLVFEYLEGGTLSDRLVRARLSPRQAVELGIALCGVLERIHDAGILHRDIKPSNIGFTRDGVPKLLDFGLARIVEDTRPESAAAGAAAVPIDVAERRTASIVGSSAATGTGRLVGTPLYLSPEAVRGEPADLGFDLWGLAVVLCEAIAGRNPFAAATVADTMRRILAAPPDLDALLDDAELRAFFHRALALDPGRRPARASDLRQELTRLEARLTV